MKTILLEFFNQKKLVNNRNTVINSVLGWVNKNPAIFLWSIWTSYLFLDIGATFLLGESIASYSKMIINFLGGGILCQFWFFVFLPRSILENKWKTQILALGLLILVFLISKGLIDFFPNPEIQTLKVFLILELLRIFNFLVFTGALWVLFVFATLQKEKNEMEVYLERLKIEHRALQLSPHFVLNMMTQYAASILKLSKNLFDSMTKFSFLLSYSYKSLDRENFLAQEIQGIDNFIDCQRQRFDSKLQLFLKKDIENLPTDRFFLPKWTLLTFVENMFKHGDCFDQSHPCQIIIGLKPDNSGDWLFTLSLTNALVTNPHIPSTEFGLSAVDRILKFYFSQDYLLLSQKSSEEFNLLLIINYHGKSAHRPD